MFNIATNTVRGTYPGALADPMRRLNVRAVAGEAARAVLDVNVLIAAILSPTARALTIDHGTSAARMIL